MKVTATYDFEVSDADMEKAVAKAVEKQLSTDPDLVQVVRCRDCKHSWEDISGRVCSYGLLVDCNVPDDFGCVNGERNGGETNGS